MPSERPFTVNEHYIPRIYLKGFSETKGQNTNKEKSFVWQFNVKKILQTSVPVNINKICYEKNLYELRNEDGLFIARNTIEKAFSKIEGSFGKVIESIQKRSLDNKCENCCSFLSDEEKSILIIFITSLIYRDPVTLERGIDYIKDVEPNVSYEEAKIFTLMNLLPLGLDSQWDQNTIIRTAIENLSGMAFQIGQAPDDIIITSDRPIVQWLHNGKKFPYRPKALVFPLTSRLVLYLFPAEIVKKSEQNLFFQLSRDQINDIQYNVAVFAREWVYSRNKLSNEQLELIRDALLRCRDNSIESSQTEI